MIWVTNTTFLNLGLPLTKYVDTFVGVSGGNYGVYWCAYDPVSAFCNSLNGYDPTPSTFLAYLNSNKVREGKYVFTMYSTADDIVGDLVGTS
jgi:triacylglycerol lipase